MLTDFGNIINCDTFSVAPSVVNDNLNKHAAPLQTELFNEKTL